MADPRRCTIMDPKGRRDSLSVVRAVPHQANGGCKKVFLSISCARRHGSVRLRYYATYTLLVSGTGRWTPIGPDGNPQSDGGILSDTSPYS